MRYDNFYLILRQDNNEYYIIVTILINYDFLFLMNEYEEE